MVFIVLGVPQLRVARRGQFDVEMKILQQKTKVLPLKNDDFGASRSR